MNLKNFQVTQRDSNPWPLRCRCSALTNWAKKSHSWEQVNLLGSCFPLKGMSYERNVIFQFFRFMRQLLKIVQQVRGSYLHLISNTALHITFLSYNIHPVDKIKFRSILPHQLQSSSFKNYSHCCYTIEGYRKVLTKWRWKSMELIINDIFTL